MMTLVALGVGDAFSALHYSTCLAVGAEGRWLLVDCPHPIRKILRESGTGLDVHSFDAVLLTHLHADHASGLEGFGYFSWFVLQKKPKLVAWPEAVARLWEGHLAAGMERLLSAKDWSTREMRLEDYFEPVPMALDRPLTLGPFTIECRPTIHHIPTTAFRIRAAGRTLGYSADTAFDESLIAWLAEADLVVHETNLGVHTPYEKLAALPEDLRRKMRLVHYLDEFDVERSAIEALRQGQRVEF